MSDPAGPVGRDEPDLCGVDDTALRKAWHVADLGCLEQAERIVQCQERGDDPAAIRPTFDAYQYWHAIRAQLESEAMRRGLVFPRIGGPRRGTKSAPGE